MLTKHSSSISKHDLAFLSFSINMRLNVSKSNFSIFGRFFFSKIYCEHKSDEFEYRTRKNVLLHVMMKSNFILSMRDLIYIIDRQNKILMRP